MSTVITFKHCDNKSENSEKKSIERYRELFFALHIDVRRRVVNRECDAAARTNSNLSAFISPSSVNTNGRDERIGLKNIFKPFQTTQTKHQHQHRQIWPFMDIKVGSAEQEPSVNPNLVITITMKKMDSPVSSGAASSAWETTSMGKHDSNNNDGAKSVKKESAAKEFCKNLFNKSSSSGGGDKNNNQSPPVSNQYTKVTVDGLMSQLTLHQNRQMINQLAQQGNALALNHSEANKRWVVCEVIFRRSRW